jgi:hypothetical protein
MSKQIALNLIIDAIIKGFGESIKLYHKMTNGEELYDKAPEYLATVKIAEKIMQIEGPKTVFFEHNIYELIENAGGKCPGKYSDGLRIDGRCDIVVCRGNGSPRGLIEIKSPLIGTSEINKDLKRIAEMLVVNNGYHTLQFGIFAFYMMRSKRDIEKELNKKIDHAKEIAKSFDLRFSESTVEIKSDIPSVISCFIFQG